jgi:hypothetical protein
VVKKYVNEKVKIKKKKVNVEVEINKKNVEEVEKKVMKKKSLNKMKMKKGIRKSEFESIDYNKSN